MENNMENNNRIKGTVSWFRSDKGFGFIIGENTTEYFVHFSDIQGDGFKELYEGQKVELTPVKDSQGRDKAMNVGIVEKPKKE